MSFGDGTRRVDYEEEKESPCHAEMHSIASAYLLFFCAVRRSCACMWDYDTIRDEKRGLPGIAEILAGRFEKHSRFFYEQRVVCMTTLLRSDPKNLDAWDNLAVAYEKLDDRDKAIETILKKDRIASGQYTTYANLGTFYLHKGDLENGILAIRKAIEINPDAHFGREEYQLKVAEFLLAAKKEPRLLSEMNFLEYAGVLKPLPRNFQEYMAAHHYESSPETRPATQPVEESEQDLQELLQSEISERVSRGHPLALSEMGVKENVFDGIAGMIRFGTGTSAELYLTLGDLLVARRDLNLAYRAYQCALDFDHPRKAYLEEIMKRISDRIYYKDQIRQAQSGLNGQRRGVGQGVSEF